MAEPYANTISGLLRKRAELMGNAQRLREELAHVGNNIEALDRTLIALGYDLKAVQPRGNRIVFFARDELRRILLDELRKAHGLVSSRDLAEKIIGLEGKDAHDRRLRNDMVKWVGKSLKLLRRQRLAISARGPNDGLIWSITLSCAGRMTMWARSLSCRLCPIDEPWKAKGARALDSQTLGAWFGSRLNVPSATRR